MGAFPCDITSAIIAISYGTRNRSPGLPLRLGEIDSCRDISVVGVFNYKVFKLQLPCSKFATICLFQCSFHLRFLLNWMMKWNFSLPIINTDENSTVRDLLAFDFGYFCARFITYFVFTMSFHMLYFLIEYAPSQKLPVFSPRT